MTDSPTAVARPDPAAATEPAAVVRAFLAGAGRALWSLIGDRSSRR